MASAEVHDQTLSVEVVRSPHAGAVDSLRLLLPAGSCVDDVLRWVGADVSDVSLGVWGKLCKPGQKLRDGDRVELYRPLQVDPKDARRLRQRRQSRKDDPVVGDGANEHPLKR